MIIIDNSRKEHVMNESKNVVILVLWSERDVSDRYLVNELLSWIQPLHQSRS